MNKILVIAAHPDDEILGVGGTIVKHISNGDEVTIIVVCEGESLRYSAQDLDHQSQIFEAGKVLGVKDIRSFKFPDQKLETLVLTDIIEPLVNVVREIKPRVVYTQFGGDMNHDHYLLFKAVLVATRPTEEFIEEVLAFDTASSTEWAYPRAFVPDTWIDISPYLDRKLEAMAMYRSELREYPHPRSIESLKYKAKSWGNQVCMDAAEVFMTIRRIKRGEKTV